jgi:hypothetical protein
MIFGLGFFNIELQSVDFQQYILVHFNQFKTKHVFVFNLVFLIQLFLLSTPVLGIQLQI